jgi:hypothetical protein
MKEEEDGENSTMKHFLHSFSSIIRSISCMRIIWVGHVECMREMRSACKIFVEKSERETPLERHGRTRYFSGCGVGSTGSG